MLMCKFDFVGCEAKNIHETLDARVRHDEFGDPATPSRQDMDGPQIASRAASVDAEEGPLVGETPSVIQDGIVVVRIVIGQGGEFGGGKPVARDDPQLRWCEKETVEDRSRNGKAPQVSSNLAWRSP
jgi:hypothetical protein